MKRNATANAGPFISPPGTFLAAGILVPAALRLRERETEAFRFNSGNSRGNEIDLLQRAALNSLVEKFH